MSKTNERRDKSVVVVVRRSGKRRGKGKEKEKGTTRMCDVGKTMSECTW